MPKRVRRKDLKSPDEFLSLTQRVLAYARQNRREVIIGALTVVSLMALALGVRAYRNWQTGRASDALRRAYQELAADHLDLAADSFTVVASSWPSTLEGKLALVYAGNCYAELGRKAEANSTFTELLARTRDEEFRQIALYNLGVLKRETGDSAGAQEDLGAAAAVPGPLRGVAWLTKLRERKLGGELLEATENAVPSGLSPEAREYAASRLAAGDLKE